MSNLRTMYNLKSVQQQKKKTTKLLLFFLHRLEKQNASPHLKQMLVSVTIPDCVSTILQIAARYLDNVMDFVSLSTLYSPNNGESSEPDKKKIKLLPSETNKIELANANMYKRHIHMIFELLDITEVGAKDETLCMTDIIKMSQLSAKYFFWSMIEEGKSSLR